MLFTHQIAYSDAGTIQNEENKNYELVYKPDNILSDDFSARAEIKGNSCKQIKAKITNLDNNVSLYDGTLYCLPYIDTVEHIIENIPVDYINSTEVVFQNGFRLLKYEKNELTKKELFEKYQNNDLNLPPAAHQKIIEYIPNIPENAKKIHNKFYVVQEIYTCSNSNDIFCAVIDEYSVENKIQKEFLIFCRNCQQIKQSTTNLQESILFYKSGYGLLLKDGIAFEQKNIAQNLVPHLREIIISTAELSE